MLFMREGGVGRRAQKEIDRYDFSVLHSAFSREGVVDGTGE